MTFSTRFRLTLKKSAAMAMRFRMAIQRALAFWHQPCSGSSAPHSVQCFSPSPLVEVPQFPQCLIFHLDMGELCPGAAILGFALLGSVHRGYCFDLLAQMNHPLAGPLPMWANRLAPHLQTSTSSSFGNVPSAGGFSAARCLWSPGSWIPSKSFLVAFPSGSNKLKPRGNPHKRRVELRVVDLLSQEVRCPMLNSAPSGPLGAQIEALYRLP